MMKSKAIITNESRETVSILVVYFISVWLSVKYADGYAVVGPIFGLAVVAFDSKFFRNILKEKHLSFILASTLIYALVYSITSIKWESQIALVNYLIGPFPIGVVLGSILLPTAHKMIFKKPAALMRQVIFSLIASFYVVSLLAYFYNEFKWGIRFSFLGVSIAVWQGIYLYLFYSKKQKN